MVGFPKYAPLAALLAGIFLAPTVWGQVAREPAYFEDTLETARIQCEQMNIPGPSAACLSGLVDTREQQLGAIIRSLLVELPPDGKVLLDAQQQAWTAYRTASRDLLSRQGEALGVNMSNAILAKDALQLQERVLELQVLLNMLTSP